MKLYLIAALFIATLVVVPCLAEEEKQETTEQVADVPEVADQNKNDEAPSVATDNEGDAKDEAPSVATDREGDAKDEGKAEDTEDHITHEFRDEIEKVKRGFPQLSASSCRILRKYGYCKYVAKFCIKICTCNDKLSAVSCHRVRYTYRACNKNIGRVYCAKKCGYCDGLKQCRYYTRINDITRRQSRPKRRYQCDNKLRTGWYRFVGAQGTYIPNRCVPVNRCGTAATGWMVGGYPGRRGQTVRRKVCYHWSKNCCRWSNYIQVTHCGGFYVFYLTKPPGCHFRYCGNR